MKHFFLFKIKVGLALAAIMLLVSTVVPLTLLSIFPIKEFSAFPQVTSFFLVLAAILITVVFIATYTAPNLAWLMTLRTSKTKIWFWNYLSSVLIILVLTLALGAGAYLVDRIEVSTSFWEIWRECAKMLRDFFMSFFRASSFNENNIAFSLAYLGGIHFVASMLDFKPGRRAAYTVAAALVWIGVFLAGAYLNFGEAIIFLLIMTMVLTFQSPHARARLEMSRRQFVRIGSYFLVIWFILGVGPSLAAVRAKKSESAEVVRRGYEFLGPLASVDREHLTSLLYKPAANEWEFSWVIGKLDAMNRITPRDANIDFKKIASAQTQRSVLQRVASILDESAQIQDLEILMDRAEVIPSADSAAEAAFAAAALNMPDAEGAAVQFAGAAGSVKKITGLILLRHFPSEKNLQTAFSATRDADQRVAKYAVATVSILTGVPYYSAASLPDAVSLPPAQDLCGPIERESLCKSLAKCRSPSQKECLVVVDDYEAKINLCLRFLPNVKTREYERIEERGWLNLFQDNFLISSLLECHPGF